MTDKEETRAAVDALFNSWWVWQSNEAMVQILLESRTRLKIDEGKDNEWTPKPQPSP